MAVKLLLACALVCAALAAPQAPESRIVGGTPVTIQEFPYIAALVYYYPRPAIYIQRCVGSVISSWHILTTAFCFSGADLSNMQIRAGSTNSLSGGTVVGILEVIKHPGYVEIPRANDIAVTVLNSPLFISDTIDVLYIPPQGTFIPDGTPTKVVSWGFESDSGEQLENLKTITLNKVPLEECKQAYADASDVVVIDDPVICAAKPGNFGTCRGDSGAPMVIENVVVGLSSVYRECGTDAYPDVFTRIDRYTDWILEVATAPRTGAPRTGVPVRVANPY